MNEKGRQSLWTGGPYCLCCITGSCLTLLGKLERQLAKADLLILDELSYLGFNRYESDLLFKVISDRSEQSSTIVTTNLPFKRWTELFENTTMVSALVDRLTYKSAVLDMNGPSYWPWY